jgi:hypothetical protein
MGWFTITILLPCLAPLLASLTFKLLTLPEGAEASPMKAFRDGQLCWTALGFCAAAQYELAQQQSIADWQYGLLNVVMVLSSLLAAGGAMFPVVPYRNRDTSWLRHHRVFVCSVGLTVTAAGIYCTIHF